ncbi:MAG TPA: hypothetical protein VGM81_14470 [Burkholderiaceae bacterium]|jgi:DNA-binding NarL/FixJ family response regulator
MTRTSAGQAATVQAGLPGLLRASISVCYRRSREASALLTHVWNDRLSIAVKFSALRRSPDMNTPEQVEILLVDDNAVLTRIKGDAGTRRIPVVIMTSSQEESDIARTYDLGANSYIVKPLDFGAMVDVMRQAGFYWLAINQHPLSR